MLQPPQLFSKLPIKRPSGLSFDHQGEPRPAYYCILYTLWYLASAHSLVGQRSIGVVSDMPGLTSVVEGHRGADSGAQHAQSETAYCCGQQAHVM
jgi:hypothetical protein